MLKNTTPLEIADTISLQMKPCIKYLQHSIRCIISVCALKSRDKCSQLLKIMAHWVVLWWPLVAERGTNWLKLEHLILNLTLSDLTKTKIGQALNCWCCSKPQTPINKWRNLFLLSSESDEDEVLLCRFFFFSFFFSFLLFFSFFFFLFSFLEN